MVVCALAVLAPRAHAQTLLSDDALSRILVATAPANTAPIAAPAEVRGESRALFTWSVALSTALVQAADAHSTMMALDAGAAEGNPIVEPFARHQPSLIAFKAGVSVATIVAVHRLAGRHKVAAALLTAAINGTYVAIALHNYQLAHRLRGQ
jgi:hypothetical protein